MKWQIEGIKQDTGKRVRGSVEADDEAQARRRAARHGIDVELASPCDAGAIVPSVTRPAPQTVAQRTAAPTIIEQPLESAASRLSRFMSEGQDPDVIAKVILRLEGLMTSQEHLDYIAVQQRPIANFSPDCIACTNRRIIILRQKMLGRMAMADFAWKDVHDVQVAERVLGGVITVRPLYAPPQLVDYLPKPQARKVYRHAQEAEEAARDLRRELDLEERRASAGGVQIANVVNPQQQAPASAPAGGAMAKLQELKQMLDAGLITQADYDGNKQRLMEAM